MKRFSVINGVELDESLEKQWLELDSRVFPEGSGNEVDPEYLKGLFATKEQREGLFFLRDNQANKLAGYMARCGISDSQRDAYMSGEIDFTQIKNIGMKKGDNNMYLFTTAMDENYRGIKAPAALPVLCQAFADWITELEQQGKNITHVLSDAVTKEGADLDMKLFELQPHGEHDEDGCGHYVGKNLDGFVGTMDKRREAIKKLNTKSSEQAPSGTEK